MTITTNHYTFEMPDAAAPAIIASIPDDQARERIQAAVDDDTDGTVRLPLSLADTLLNASAEWERAQGAGE